MSMWVELTLKFDVIIAVGLGKAERGLGLFQASGVVDLGIFAAHDRV